jgi:hypothetical protein
MIAGVHIVALMASVTALVPSAPSLFDARLRAAIALLSVGERFGTLSYLFVRGCCFGASVVCQAKWWVWQ